jgi:predicted amidohydrolase YtcJ
LEAESEIIRVLRKEQSVFDMDHLAPSFLLAIFLLSPGIVAQPPSQQADLILRHGVVLTVDAADSIAEAIAIRDGRIIAVGQDEAVSRLAGPRTRVIELAGKTVTPGLIDTHAHLLSSGMDETLKVDLTRAGSLNELMSLVKARVDTIPAEQWAEGFGWNEGILAEHRGPTLAELDAISGDHPVLLENVTHHYSIVNGAAMRLAHIDAATPDPAGGKIERAPDGKPTGMLRERPAIDMVAKLIPPFTPEQYRRVLARMIDQLHAEGMTGVKDIVNPREWAAYVTSAQAAKLSVHACPLFWAGSTVESAKATLDAITQARQRVTPLADGDLKVCGAKILLDGSAAGRTAWRNEDYPVDAGHPAPTGKGFPIVDPDVYKQMVLLFNAAKVSVGTHAIGDRAIDLTVDAYAEALRQNPATGLRHSIIHAHEPTEHALSVMADLQKHYDAAIPETQAEFLWWLGDVLPGAFGPEQSKHLMPLATYRKRGIVFASGSDFGVTPLAARYGLWASVARQPLKGTFGPQPFGTDEAIDVHTALKSYTIWAARQIFEEKNTGSLEPGKWADFAVWDRNPYTVPTGSLKDMQCLMTFYKGKVVFER